MAEGSKTVKFLWLNLMQNRRATRFGKVVIKNKREQTLYKIRSLQQIYLR